MLTVVLATHNGERTLPQTLESFCRLVVPAGGWKLIAVDNCSDDGTAEILRRYAERLPLEAVHEPTRGKNHALNRALALLEGDLAVFTDDDVIAEPDWLVAMRAAADRQPEYDVFGGVIRPYWPDELPSWLDTVPYGIVYGLTREGRGDGPMEATGVFGGNMAVRTAVFAEGYRFNEKVGPSRGQYRMGSETELTARLALAGKACWHAADACVQHIIRAEQLDPAWVAARGYRLGRDIFWKENDPALPATEGSRDVPMLLGLPRWYFKAFGKSLARSVGSRLRGVPATARVRWEWQTQFWRGYFREAFREGRKVRGARRARRSE